MKLQGVYRLISLTGHEGIAVMKTTKQTKMTNIKFDHIIRQQYAIVFNHT